MAESVPSGARLGMNCKLYYCTDGIGGTPTWTEIGNATDVTLNLEQSEADATTRGNNGWKATVPTLKDGSIEFEMMWNTSDTAFTTLFSAWLANDLIGIAAMDADITLTGAQGLWADCRVMNMSRIEPLTDIVKAKVTLKPTYSTNAPTWTTIGGD